MNSNLSISREKIAEFCGARGIRRMAVFGSALRGDFGPDSDVDILVEFKASQVPGLFGMVRLERQMSSLFNNRKVDLRPPRI